MNGPWINHASTYPNLIQAYQDRFPEDELTQVLVMLVHQLSTDSDLDSITGARKYQILLWQIRDAMAKKLGYSSYEPRPE